MQASQGWRIETVAANELDGPLVAAWESLRAEWPEYRSPFFSSGYTRMLAQVRPDVECAVLSQDGRIAGFFPFQRDGRSATPVGGTLTDFQGIVIPPQADLAPEELLRACRLNHWSFRYLARGWETLDRCRFRRQRSPVINLENGFGTFTRSLEQRKSDLLHKHVRGLRSLAKRVGPTRFEWQCEAPDLLDRLLRWKAAQHERTETRDEFRPPWAREMLERMLGEREAAFSARVAGLYAGESLVAGAVNLISGSTLHVWITAYNPEFAKFSPGAHCMVELIRAASAMGIRRVDLGHGEEPYKYRLCSEIDEVAEGCVDRRWLLGWSHRGRYEVRRRVLDSSLRPLLQHWKKRLRSWQARWRPTPAADSHSSEFQERRSESNAVAETSP
jgi:CelD/BcsL family acetyltransferase involved in cellulose biosynthesis